MFDIIAKKRDRGILTAGEIGYFVSGCTRGEIPEYQTSALLMAIRLNGMTAQETAALTACMAASGDRVDLSSVPGVKVDKHSTGGVGDKTTLICCPVAAACGVKIAKMSGRGLGYTGGTVDKLASIPGYRTVLPRDEFLAQVRRIGISLIGQSGELAPADKKIYALRDVTATVDSMPLIASSIMSKKLAAGADAILLDVKTGSGAFMKTEEESVSLARRMVSIGESSGKRTTAVITGMGTPLGFAVGNSLEVAEAVQTLQGNGPEDLREVSLYLAACMLELAGQGSHETCLRKAGEALCSGAAFRKFRELVAAQGGDISCIDDPSRFSVSKYRETFSAAQDGFITDTDTEAIGACSLILGAGRERIEDEIDPSAGLLLYRKRGDRVQKGEIIAEFHSSDLRRIAEARIRFARAVTIGSEKPAPVPLILARVDESGVTKYAGH